ncbi:MAG: hypothetical protein ABIP30_08820 [Ferruginibacter sp.]
MILTILFSTVKIPNIPSNYLAKNNDEDLGFSFVKINGDEGEE